MQKSTQQFLYLDDKYIVYGDSRAKLTTKRAPLFVHLLLLNTLNTQPLTHTHWKEAINIKEKNYSALQRIQISRVIDDVSRALALLHPSLYIKYDMHHRTTGPWHLILPSNIKIRPFEYHAPISSNHYFFQNMDVTDLKWASSICSIVNIILNGDSLFQNGLHQEANEVFSNIPNEPTLSSELKAIFILRQVRTLKCFGHFTEAQELCIHILNDTDLAPQSPLKHLAQFFISRLKYDINPMIYYQTLLSETQQPQEFYHPDIITLMNWHNLQALLMRRQLENTNIPDIKHHHLALRHYEEALFWALWVENLTQAQNIILNLAFHLQQVLPYKWASFNDIIYCYQLSLVFNDKCGCGDYSIWDRIFFAHFYWTYIDLLHISPESTYLFTKDINPGEEEFYIKSIQFLDKNNDLRQKANLYFLYAKYAQQHLSSHKKEEIIQQAIKYIKTVKQNSLVNKDYDTQLNELYSMLG